MGSATMEGRIDMGEKVIINIKTFADDRKPPDRVIPAMLQAAGYFPANASSIFAARVSSSSFKRESALLIRFMNFPR